MADPILLADTRDSWAYIAPPRTEPHCQLSLLLVQEREKPMQYYKSAEVYTD